MANLHGNRKHYYTRMRQASTHCRLQQQQMKQQRYWLKYIATKNDITKKNQSSNSLLDPTATITATF
ncbi:1992_t:CDS:2, partial [Funneliformis geosporum]